MTGASLLLLLEPFFAISPIEEVVPTSWGITQKYALNAIFLVAAWLVVGKLYWRLHSITNAQPDLEVFAPWHVGADALLQIRNRGGSATVSANARLVHEQEPGPYSVVWHEGSLEPTTEIPKGAQRRLRVASHGNRTYGHGYRYFVTFWQHVGGQPKGIEIGNWESKELPQRIGIVIRFECTPELPKQMLRTYIVQISTDGLAIEERPPIRRPNWFQRLGLRMAGSQS